MGFPKDYTMSCMPKKDQGSQRHTDCRLSLIGNSWNVSVVAWLLGQLGETLGINSALTPSDIVRRTSPGCTVSLQTYLHRPLLHSSRRGRNTAKAKQLVDKLLTMVSVKGEDLLLQHASEDLVKYHRLRSSIPAKLWKWRTVASWAWTDAAGLATGIQSIYNWNSFFQTFFIELIIFHFLKNAKSKWSSS